jgi:hypothetical protein
MRECARGMYEEIDRSGQAKWTLPTIMGFIVIVGLLTVKLFGDPLGDPPYTNRVDVVFLIGFAPLGACLLGSLFGALRKRTEGDFRTGDMGGHPVYGCGWAITLMLTVFLGFMVLFSMDVIGPVIGSIVEIILVAVFYMAGYVSAFRGAPMGSKLVKDPLHHRITKYLTKYDVLQSITQCDLVSEIIVRYKIGKGQTLKVIDEIRVLAATTTEPSFEVEITIEKMENIGPEYTYYLSEGLATQKEEMIDVAGKEARLLVDEVDMKSFIRVRYDMGTLRARWNLGTPESLCHLMHALLDEVARYVSFTIVPKIEDSGLDE